MEIKTYKGYKNADFSVKLESASPDSLYLHIEVFKWNHNVLKHMYKVFASIEYEAELYGFKAIVAITPNPKFGELFGFTRFDTIQYGGKQYEVMVWDLK